MLRKPGIRSGLVISMALAAVLVLVVSGCGNKSDDPGGVVPEELVENINLTAGQSHEYTLESNASTGFSWEISVEPDEKIIKITDHEYVEPEDTSMVGAPGEEVWKFKAEKAGKTTMVLEYVRSWEEELPEMRVTLHFNVD